MDEDSTCDYCNEPYDEYFLMEAGGKSVDITPYSKVCTPSPYDDHQSLVVYLHE